MARKYLIILSLFIMVCTVMPSPAHAQIDACSWDGLGLTTQVVGCVERVMRESALLLLGAVSELPVMNDILNFLLVFYTLVFGVRIVTGETELTKKGWEWLIKFGLVILFSNNLGGFGLAEGLLDAMDELQGYVTDSFGEAVLSNSRCIDSPGFVASGIASYLTGKSMVWAHVDCMLLRVFGFGGDEVTFGGAIIGIVSAALFSGTMGVMIFTMGVMSMLAILSLAYRAVLAYALSYAVVAIMIIISPLIVPMALFNFTNMVFDAWRRALLGAVFLPAFITAYMFIAMPLIDYAIFGAANSLNNVISLEELSEAHRNEAAKCGQLTIEEERGDEENVVTDGDQEAADERKNALNEMQSLATNLCKLFPVPSIDLGEYHDGIMIELGLSLMTLFVICWMVKKMLESIVGLATFLMRGGHAISSVMQGGGSLGRYVAKATNGTGI